MKDFKFLDDNENQPVWDGATWSYVRLENLTQYSYDVMVDNSYGIRSFLNHFPDNFIVSILSITGPTGIVHDANNFGMGWGFDITSDLIRIEWIRYRP
jgi:hypothetical protein